MKTVHNHRAGAILALGSGLLAAGATFGAGGDIVWSRGLVAPEGAAPPRTGPDGALYWAARGLLHKADLQGRVVWHRAGTSSFGFGAGNTVYLAGTTEGSPALSAVRAITTDNQLLWEYTDLPGIQGFIGGPDVGPDGNVYATADGPSNGPGTFSLTPAGAFRWNVPGFGNIAGTPPSHLVFTAQAVYKADNITPTVTGLFAGLVAVRLDSGSTPWIANYSVPASGPGRQPRVNPVTGQINTSRWSAEIESFRADGSVAWTYFPDFAVSELDVGPDGSIYVLTGNRDVISLTSSGQLRWTAPQVVPNNAGGATAMPIAVSPDGQTVVFATTACYGYTCPGSVVALSAATGAVRWSIPLPVDPAGVPSTVFEPVSFSPDSSLVYVAATLSATASRLYAICVAGTCPPPASCYANCDGSTTLPVLNVQDLACFLNRFAAGDAYANCDGSTTPPVLNVQDFSCFLNRFAAGCS